MIHPLDAQQSTLSCIKSLACLLKPFTSHLNSLHMIEFTSQRQINPITPSTHHNPYGTDCRMHTRNEYTSPIARCPHYHQSVSSHSERWIEIYVTEQKVYIYNEVFMPQQIYKNVRSHMCFFFCTFNQINVRRNLWVKLGHTCQQQGSPVWGLADWLYVQCTPHWSAIKPGVKGAVCSRCWQRHGRLHRPCSGGERAQ